MAGLVIAAVAAGLVLRSMPTPVESEQAANAARDSVLAESRTIAPVPAAVAESATLTAKDTSKAPKRDTSHNSVQDSLKRMAALARKRSEDSVAHVTEVATNGARAAFTRFVNAFGSGNATGLKSAYPAMTQSEQDAWQKNYFDQTSKIDAQLSNFGVTVSGDSAEASYMVKLSLVKKGSGQTSESAFRQRARLVRKGGEWQILSVTAR